MRTDRQTFVAQHEVPFMQAEPTFPAADFTTPYSAHTLPPPPYARLQRARGEEPGTPLDQTDPGPGCAKSSISWTALADLGRFRTVGRPSVLHHDAHEPPTGRPTSIRPPAVTTSDDSYRSSLNTGSLITWSRRLFDHFAVRGSELLCLLSSNWRRQPRSVRARCSPSRPAGRHSSFWNTAPEDGTRR